MMFKCELCDRVFENNIGLVNHSRYCYKTIKLKDEVIKLYKNNYSILEISRKLKLSKYKISIYLGEMIRNKSESSILSNKKYPRKHTEESKQKIREKHIKWLKENPDKTAWRLSNLSYPEKLFLDKIIELGWDKKYLIVREKSIFPFYIDFAFENEKVAVEIDGSQHLEEERKLKDIKKDKLLNDNGWSVIRITDFEIKNDIDRVFEILFNNLSIENVSNTKVGILKECKKYVKKERESHGFTKSEIKGQIKQRKTERPVYSILIKQIKEFGLEGTGRKYGVSGNTIKKWRKYYEKIEKQILEKIV